MGNSVKAQCRRCSGMAPADQFKLHYEYRMMVCPQCFKGKNAPPVRNVEKQRVEKKEQKPAGWDEVDTYLEKMESRRKQQQPRGEFSKIPGTNQVKYKCFKCSFKFRYDPFRKRPKTCPYCNEEVPKLRTFNLL